MWLIFLAGFLLFIGVVAVMFIAFIVWALHEHRLADRYRELLRLHKELKTNGSLEPKSAHWAIEFKDGKIVKKVSSLKATEGEAVLEFTRKYPHAKILSVSRVT